MFRTCVLLLFLSLFASAHAQEACPWLTRGTAAALMGGDVSASVHVSAGEGTCEFMRGAQGDRDGGTPGSSLQIRIEVGHLPLKECATGDRLAGIGQDAIFCRMDAGREHHEIIGGRVRGRYFWVIFTEREVNDNDKTSRRRFLEEAAEEVAGNLF